MVNNFIEYEKSITALKLYLEQNKKRPSEKVWNKYANEKGLLSGRTLGYLSGKGFNLLCRELIKTVKND